MPHFMIVQLPTRLKQRPGVDSGQRFVEKEAVVPTLRMGNSQFALRHALGPKTAGVVLGTLEEFDKHVIELLLDKFSEGDGID